MITITIGQDSCQISETQLHWFKTLEHAVEYSTESPNIIHIPEKIGGQQITMRMFKQLLNLYHEEISSKQITHGSRSRGILEHYLEGILDDISGQIEQVIGFLYPSLPRRLPVDLTLYQLISQYVNNHDCTKIIGNYDESRVRHILYESLFTGRVVWLGSLEIVKYFVEYIRLSNKFLDKNHKCNDYYNPPCPWSIREFDVEILCAAATYYNKKNILQYAVENQCPWIWGDMYDPCALAAITGNLEILQYLHTHGCPWYTNTCVHAAECGHLEILKYAHENGCPWNNWTRIVAEQSEHLDCIQYANDHDCPTYIHVCDDRKYYPNLKSYP